MSLEAMAIALHHSRAKGTAKLVLLGIANHDGDGGAYPSMRTLAKYASCDIRTARRGVAKLIQLGEIRSEVQGGGDRDWIDELRPNLYHFLLTCPAGCDRTKHHRMPGENVTAPLWKNPRTPPPPRTDMTGAPPGPGVLQTDPLLTPPQGPASTTGHATPAATGPLCSICSLERIRCQAAQAKWRRDDRHEFTIRERPTP